MKLSRVFYFAILTMSVLASSAFADVKIKVRQTMSGQSYENTTYIKGKRMRAEHNMGEAMQMISLTQCDLKRGVSDIGQSNDLNPHLTDGRNFDNFVKPHLITGPKKTYPYTVKNDPTDWQRWKVYSRKYDIDNTLSSLKNEFSPDETLTQDYPALSPQTYGVEKQSGPSVAEFENHLPVAGDFNQTFSKEVKLAPKQILEIEVPVEAAPSFGITFVANPNVSVSLLNEKGVLVSRNLKDSPLASLMFRMVMTAKPVAKSIWKLKLENTTDTEQMFSGFGWSVSLPPDEISTK